MNKLNLMIATCAMLLFSTNLFSQAPPAEFDFPTGCTQATLNGTSFIVEVKIDGMAPELNADWVAVFNADDDVVGRAIVENILNNGVLVSGAQLVLREAQGSSGCSAIYPNGPVTVKLHDASEGAVLIAANSVFTALNDNSEIDGPDGTGATVDVFDFSASLPVTLANFSANRINEVVELNWTTTAETDNSHFEIERSSNPASGFEAIGKVEGNGTAEGFNDYTFKDFVPANGMNYYRLRQVDFDGTAERSPVVVVEMETSPERKVSAFPNPAASNGRLTIRLGGEWAKGSTNIRLVDAAGRLVTEWNNVNAASLNTELPTLPAGIYQLIASDVNDRKAIRLMVR